MLMQIAYTATAQSMHASVTGLYESVSMAPPALQSDPVAPIKKAMRPAPPKCRYFLPTPRPDRQTKPTLRQMIGQILIIGFKGSTVGAAGFKEVLDLVRRGELGGVIFFRRNIGSRKSLTQMIEQVRRASKIAAPFIAVDQEGGKVARLGRSVGLRRVPSAASIGSRKLSPEQAGEIYDRMAKSLAGLGFNLNFGPVVDLNTNKANPIIGRRGRSYSAEPQLVVRYARAFVEAHRLHGVATSLKHFPGHGSSRFDSHIKPVDISATWLPIELEPFAKLVESCHADSIMVGHLKLQSDGFPATLDQRIILEMIRVKLSYTGLVIADDLRMNALKKYGSLAQRAAMAIRAGNDLLIVSSKERDDNGMTTGIIDELAEIAAADANLRALIGSAFSKVITFRRSIGYVDTVNLTTPMQ
jgi:beta-N-acetylhexosaminidase